MLLDLLTGEVLSEIDMRSIEKEGVREENFLEGELF